MFFHADCIKFPDWSPQTAVEKGRREFVDGKGCEGCEGARGTDRNTNNKIQIDICNSSDSDNLLS